MCRAFPEEPRLKPFPLGRARPPALPRWSFLFSAWLVVAGRSFLLRSMAEQLSLGEASLGVGFGYDAFALSLLFLLGFALQLLPVKALRRLGVGALGLAGLVLVISNQIYATFFREALEPQVLREAGDLWLVRGSIVDLAGAPELAFLLGLPLLLLGLAVRESATRQRLTWPRAGAGLLVAVLGTLANHRSNVTRPWSADTRPHLLRTNVLLRWAGAPLRQAPLRDADGGNRLAVEPAWLTPERLLEDFPLEPGTRALALAGYPLARHRSLEGRDERLAAAGIDVAALASVGDRPNVVLVILESFRAAELGAFGVEGSTTPHLDRLAREGLLVERMYASSHQSIRGSFALQCGFTPNPSGVEYQSRHPDLHLPCWHDRLAARGYSTRWFTGYLQGYEREGEFATRHGVQQIVDMTAYPEETTRVGFGIVDHLLYEKVVQVLSEARRPFSATVTTIGSHHPFNYPPGLPGVEPPTFAGMYGRYLTGLGYADFAVGHFLEEARKQPWFDDTLFIFTGDHGLYEFPEPQDVARRGGELNPGRRAELFFRSPLLLWGPKFIRPMRLARVASQVDLLPTLLDLTATESDGVFAGASIFRELPGRRILLSGIGGIHAVQDEVRCWDVQSTPHCQQVSEGRSIYAPLRETEVQAPALVEWARRTAAVGQLFATTNHLYPASAPAPLTVQK